MVNFCRRACNSGYLNSCLVKYEASSHTIRRLTRSSQGRFCFASVLSFCLSVGLDTMHVRSSSPSGENMLVPNLWHSSCHRSRVSRDTGSWHLELSSKSNISHETCNSISSNSQKFKVSGDRTVERLVYFGADANGGVVPAKATRPKATNPARCARIEGFWLTLAKADARSTLRMELPSPT